MKLPDFGGGFGEPFDIPPQLFQVNGRKHSLNTVRRPTQRLDQAHIHQLIDSIRVETKDRCGLIHGQPCRQPAAMKEFLLVHITPSLPKLAPMQAIPPGAGQPIRQWAAGCFQQLQNDFLSHTYNAHHEYISQEVLSSAFGLSIR